MGQKPGSLDEAADPGEHGGSRRDLLTEDLDLAGVGSQQAGDQAQGRGFSGAIRAEQAEHLAAPHRERQVVNRAKSGAIVLR